jgi:hypothetical protein
VLDLLRVALEGFKLHVPMIIKSLAYYQLLILILPYLSLRCHFLESGGQGSIVLTLYLARIEKVRRSGLC